jgi:hypothetical protein
MIKVMEVPNGIQMVSGNVFFDGEMLYSTETGTAEHVSKLLLTAIYIEEAARRNGHTALLDCIEAVKVKIRS